MSLKGSMLSERIQTKPFNSALFYLYDILEEAENRSHVIRDCGWREVGFRGALGLGGGDTP